MNDQRYLFLEYRSMSFCMIKLILLYMIMREATNLPCSSIPDQIHLRD